MFSRDRWQEIFQTIGKNKLRTFLSGFTVALGIFIFVILFGMGNGLKNMFQEFFMDDAINIFYISPGRTTKPFKGFKSNRQIDFKSDDLDDIRQNFPMYVDYITPRIYRSYQIKYKNESNTYQVRGIGPANQFSEKTILMKGRYVDEKDIKNKTKYAVIGRLVEQDLFKNRNALGKYIDMGGSMYMVVGVFQDDSGDNEERRVYIPYTTLQLNEKNTDIINEIVVAFKPEIGYMGAMIFSEKLMQYMKDKHSVSPDDGAGIYIFNRAEAFEQNNKIAVVLQIIVSFVAMGTLLAGIIGISNIMVFVVKERTKELGIRKALGATPKAITAMILQESIFITTISGIIGLVIGVYSLNSIGLDLEEYFIKNPYIDIQTGIFATIILIIFGAIAGYIPARRAARIKPIEALRDE